MKTQNTRAKYRRRGLTGDTIDLFFTFQRKIRYICIILDFQYLPPPPTPLPSHTHPLIIIDAFLHSNSYHLPPTHPPSPASKYPYHRIRSGLYYHHTGAQLYNLGFLIHTEREAVSI